MVLILNHRHLSNSGLPSVTLDGEASPELSLNLFTRLPSSVYMVGVSGLIFQHIQSSLMVVLVTYASLAASLVPSTQWS